MSTATQTTEQILAQVTAGKLSVAEATKLIDAANKRGAAFGRGVKLMRNGKIRITDNGQVDLSGAQLLAVHRNLNEALAIVAQHGKADERTVEQEGRNGREAYTQHFRGDLLSGNNAEQSAAVEKFAKTFKPATK